MQRIFLLVCFFNAFFHTIYCVHQSSNCSLTIKNFICSLETHNLGLDYVANCQWDDSENWINVNYSLSYKVEQVYIHDNDEDWEEESVATEDVNIQLMAKHLSKLAVEHNSNIKVNLTWFFSFFYCFS